MPQRLQQDIAVTHFFNPVHIMKLVELVPGTQTSDRAMQRLNVFLADDLAKGVVNAKDTVNFIGNRIGCFWMLAGLHKAADADISMETVDSLMAKPIGLPPTGLYGLIDLIGLDVMDLVAKNLAANLPATDAGMAFASLPATEAAMHANGQLGRKTGGGFYKMTRTEDGGKSMETFDLAAKIWRPMAPATLDEVHQNIETMLFADDAEGRFAWDLMSATLAYSSALIPEISDDIVNVDRAMKWGFNWAQGPFELLDSIGPARFAEKLAASGGTVDGMLKVLTVNGHSSFYRNDGSEFLTLDGSYAKV
jgi:3-hydroxyacyl-CoA dehydrogenase